MTHPDFTQPFIDLEEDRLQPFPHRYVHGGFRGAHNETKFSFYFPPKEKYQGRFLQYLQGGGGGSDKALTGDRGGRDMNWLWELSFEELGAYLVESNQGHTAPGAADLATELVSHVASSETARFGREVAKNYYGTAPHHGYVGGPSGGGARSLSCQEYAPDVFDGSVPHVAVVHTAVHYSVWAYAATILGDKIAQVVDAMEPGGSGDAFAGLNSAQREALAALYRFGWPRRAESQLYPSTIWGFGYALAYGWDKDYFHDFWSKPGYYAHEEPERFTPHIFQLKTKVKRVVTARDLGDTYLSSADPDHPYGVILEHGDTSRMLWATLTMASGSAKGRELWIGSTKDSVVAPFMPQTPAGFTGVKAGDEVSVDNHDWVAFTHYWRYGTGSLPLARLPGERVLPEFRAPSIDGSPLYPQRPHIPGPQAPLNGNLKGKMILCNGTHDCNVFPTKVTPYIRMVERQLGVRMDEHFRVWWMDNATHGAPQTFCPVHNPEKRPGVWDTRLIEYSPIIRQAFKDIVAWVEEGKVPPVSTGYYMNRDNGLILANTAKERGGIQPFVHAAVNGKVRVDVAVGAEVCLEGSAEMPPGTGSLVSGEWDFDGTGAWQHKERVKAGAQSIKVSVTHKYTQPGTYYPSFRAGSHRDGANGLGKPIYNLERVRVVVR